MKSETEHAFINRMTTHNSIRIMIRLIISCIVFITVNSLALSHVPTLGWHVWLQNAFLGLISISSGILMLEVNLYPILLTEARKRAYEQSDKIVELNTQIKYMQSDLYKTINLPN